MRLPCAAMLSAKPWWIAALVSWGIALFEYLLLVPANRIGFTTLSLAQLKILQEVITMIVFVPSAVLYMEQPIRLNYVYAGICMLGAVYFIFRGQESDLPPGGYHVTRHTNHRGERPWQ